MNKRELGSFISNLRRGITPFKIISLSNGNDETFNVAVVLLSSDLMCDINDKVCEKYGEPTEVEDKQREKAKNIYYNTLLAYHCTRVPEEPYAEYIASCYEEFTRYMDLEDIQRITNAYNELLIDKCDKIELLTDERLEELVNFLDRQAEEGWKGLSTTVFIHLTNLYNTLLPILRKETETNNSQTDSDYGFSLIEG